MAKILCNCGELAVWYGLYDDYYCEKCVPRGCFCNTEYVPGTREAGENGFAEQPPTDRLWKWEKENVSWRPLDNEGRELPCCEYDYSKEGFDDL